MRLFEYTNKQAAYFDDTQLTSARCRNQQGDLELYPNILVLYPEAGLYFEVLISSRTQKCFAGPGIQTSGY